MYRDMILGKVPFQPCGLLSLLRKNQGLHIRRYKSLLSFTVLYPAKAF